MQALTIAVTATFTAEPLRESLAFWMAELSLPFNIEFAPYNQVFQQLFDRTSLLSRNRDGINIVAVRLQDWLGEEITADAPQTLSLSWSNGLQRSVADFIGALKSAPATPHIVCLCPSSITAATDGHLVSLFDQMEELIRCELSGLSNIHLVTTEQLVRLYEVKHYYDSHREKLGKVPYTEAFFAALGTSISRRIFSLHSLRRKVIVLDCDQTLWKGICGEVGAAGIEIDPPHKDLQEFVVAQHNAGFLLCLCSKNNEEDVANVFESRSEMPLKKNHLISSRINWKPKSENLKSLARELDLGLDSFIFIDDDHVACAEVESNCPGVLVLKLPEDPNHFVRFLNHVWAFDQLTRTEEDQRRTILYRQEIERNQLRSESLSFRDFLDGLNLKVQISEMLPEHVSRVSQLSQRTNQFNFTTKRRSESEVLSFCHSSKSECLVVKASDRFGDYGLVGVIIFDSDDTAVKVDTLLLSCRALGRGIEHRMLASLGEIARQRGLDLIELTYLASGKNRAALAFLEDVAGDRKEEIPAGYVFKLPAEVASGLSYNPDSTGLGAAIGVLEPLAAPVDAGPNLTSGTRADSSLFRRIATELCTCEQILKAIESQTKRTRPKIGSSFATPRTPVEKAVSALWTEVLRLDPIGVDDNFFELGGHSLLATVLLSRVRDSFQVDLSLAEFFDAPTVAGLAGLVEHYQISLTNEDEVAAILEELDGLSDEEVRALLSQEGQLASQG